MSRTLSLMTASCLCFAVFAPVVATAADTNNLDTRLGQQDRIITQQQEAITAQTRQIAEQKKLIDALIKDKGAKGSLTASEPAPSPAKTSPTATATHKSAEAAVSTHTPPVAPQTKEEPVRPQVGLLADQGGVLSPAGSLSLETTTEYTNTTRNLFTFNGVELAEVVLVGAVNNTSARRQIVQETGRLRLGLTNRLEADIHAPFVYRNDALTTTSGGVAIPSTVDGYDFGDIDVGLAYQLNSGTEGWPFLIANVRYKANNADGPYDVPYDSQNIAKRLPVGTGFQTVEGSLTAIKVSDPAVLFGNLGYVYNIPRDINKNFNGTFVNSVNPGNAINALVGMSFAVNQDVSFSLGYKHSYVFETIQNQTAGGITSDSRTGSSQVGALTLGLTYAVTPTTPLNFSAAVGATNDAPDVHLSMRIPFHLGKIF